MKYFWISFIIFFNFFGDIKKTKEKFNFLIISNRLLRSFFFSGRNPPKKYLSEKPLIEIAVVGADTPGIG